MSFAIISLLVLLLALLLLSAFFSGAETAIMRLSKIKVKHWIHSRAANSEAWANWLSKPEELIGSILVGNTLVNIFFSSTAALLAIRLFARQDPELVQTIAGIASFILVLLFGEIIPKIYCRQNPEKIASLALPPLNRLSIVLGKPLKKVLEFSSRFIPILRNPAPSRVSSLTLDEIRAIVSDPSSLKGLDREHHEMMRRVLDLHQTKVSQIMTPWSNVNFLVIEDALAGGKKLERFIDLLIESGRTRIPVVSRPSSRAAAGMPPKVIGYIFVNDLLCCISRKEKIAPALFQKSLRQLPVILPNRIVSEVLDLFRFGSPIACVQDRMGFPLGIVTFEDVLEEVVGEILDEYDVQRQQ